MIFFGAGELEIIVSLAISIMHWRALSWSPTPGHDWSKGVLGNWLNPVSWILRTCCFLTESMIHSYVQSLYDDGGSPSNRNWNLETHHKARFFAFFAFFFFRVSELQVFARAEWSGGGGEG